jgi:hypothetical protein
VPPRRRSRAGLVVALVLIGLAGVLTVVDNLPRRGHSADSGYSAGSTRAAGPATSTARRPTTGAATPSPGTAGPATPQHGGPAPVAKLADNPLFAHDRPAAPVTCPLPAWRSDPGSTDQFFRAALPCLVDAWTPVLQAANLPMRTPRVVSPSGANWSSPCGSVSGAEAAAFYCPEDETLYMPFTGLETDSEGPHPGVYLAVFAHEFGHHVQYMSGVMEQADRTEDQSGQDSDQGLEVSRRLELQAQCFSGMFLAAAAGRGGVSATVVKEAEATQARGDHPGQPHDHGSDDHAVAWWEQGYAKSSVVQCNTWLSPSPDVS